MRLLERFKLTIKFTPAEARKLHNLVSHDPLHDSYEDICVNNHVVTPLKAGMVKTVTNWVLNKQSEIADRVLCYTSWHAQQENTLHSIWQNSSSDNAVFARLFSSAFPRMWIWMQGNALCPRLPTNLLSQSRAQIQQYWKLCTPTLIFSHGIWSLGQTPSSGTPHVFVIFIVLGLLDSATFYSVTQAIDKAIGGDHYHMWFLVWIVMISLLLDNW